MFNTFFAAFLGVVNQNAPFKRASRKEKRLRLKPCLTKGLLKTKTKNKKYKSLIFKKDRVGYGEYKSYRNCLNRLIDAAKRSYMSFYQYLEENKNDPQKNLGSHLQSGK